ncbi:MAG: family 16 glycoside hydrolase [Anaerolineae bacterium]
MKRGFGILGVLCLALLLGGCGRGEGLPWEEDFSAPGAWKLESDAAARVTVEAGVLRISISAPNQLAWASAGKDLRDFRLRVEASQVAGPDDNEYGVLVRMRDPRNFYAFSVSGDGYFLVSRFVDGVRQPLGADWSPSDAVHPGIGTNILEIVAQGNRLTFIVNGRQLAQVEDDRFAHGDIGLYAGSFYEGGVEVHFDNLRVTAP